MPDCPGLTHEKTVELERHASAFNLELQRDKSTPDQDFFREAKVAAHKFINEALDLPPVEQSCVLKKAQELNDLYRVSDNGLPNINIVFSHSTGQLDRFQLSYPHFRYNGLTGFVGSNYTESRENIDLYAK